MKKLRILLIASAITDVSENVSVPIGLLSIATLLNRSDIIGRVDILDLNLEYFKKKKRPPNYTKFQKQQVKKFIRINGPYDIVGIRGLCDSYAHAIILSKFIKERYGSTVVVGGPHATFLATETMQAFPFVDYIIRHEGDVPFLQLCKCIAKNDLFNLENIQNLTYRNTLGMVCNNAVVNRYGILKKSFRLNYELVPLSDYIKVNPNGNFTVLIGFGCPYACTFCSTSLMWERTYRTRNVDNIAKEIRFLNKRHGIKKFAFVHDNLFANKNFLAQIIKGLKGLDIKWICSGRLDNILQCGDLLEEMNKVGWSSVFIGIESGSKRIQKSIRKRIRPDLTLPLLKRLNKIGIDVLFSFIIGFPEERARDLDKTICLAFRTKALGAERTNIHSLMALPGTDLYRRGQIVKRGIINNNSFYTTSFLFGDEEVRRTINSFPEVFRNHGFLKLGFFDELDVHRLARIMENYLFDYPKSYDFAFHSLNVKPSDFIGVPPSRFLKDSKRHIRKKVSALEYRIFCELIKYEKLVNQLVDESRLLGKKGGTSHGRSDLVYVKKTAGTGIRIKKGVRLLKSQVGLEYYLVPGVKRKLARYRGPSYLLLYARGKDVDCFEIDKVLYKFVSFLVKYSGLVSINRIVKHFSSFGWRLGEKKLSKYLKQLVDCDVASYY